MRFQILSILTPALALALLAAPANAATAKISVLSSRPDMVSGGDALVAVSDPAAKITLNGADISASFKPAASGGVIGLVHGLTLGANVIQAGGASLTLKNYPIQGPIFSGPRETPYYCMTDKFPLPASKETLGVAQDADCSVATRVDYVYFGTDKKYHPLPSGAAPADVATTMTSEGKSVPYIVRVETGTIDRAIYQTAVLADPAHNPTPFAPPAAWNRKLVYTFGGGCTGGWYIQGASAGNRSVLEDLMLRQGYAVASSSLNVFGNNCDMQLSAEATSMVKERFIKTYGPAKFTMGVGCSGGAEQAQPIADAYPGLLDGIIVGCSFADVITAQVMNLTETDVVYHYFENAKIAWSDAQKLAASGAPTMGALPHYSEDGGRVKPQASNCNKAIPKETQYSAANPKGVRCNVYDHLVNTLGRDPVTGKSYRPWDNVGVQYGLVALNAGAITKEQFLDLNRAIGGYDEDGNYVPQRTIGNPGAIAAAYRSGQVTNGGLGLKSTPIIDYRGYVDQPTNGGEVHSRFHSFVMRARLEKANGSSANHVMLIESGLGATGLFGDESPVLSHAVTQMDQWLTKLNAGTGARPSLKQMAAAKPADLTDACFTDNGKTKITEKQVYRGDTKCNQLFPAFSTPRLVAGEPMAFDVLKCQLKPIKTSDYKVSFTAAELAQLKTVFPGGVCNFAVPGVGQTPTQGTWRSF